jgi:hypothetical protein
MCELIAFLSQHLVEKEMNLPSLQTVISVINTYRLDLVTAANAESWGTPYCYITDHSVIAKPSFGTKHIKTDLLQEI